MDYILKYVNVANDDDDDDEEEDDEEEYNDDDDVDYRNVVEIDFNDKDNMLAMSRTFCSYH